MISRQIWRWRRKTLHAFTGGTAAVLYGWMLTRLLIAGAAAPTPIVVATSAPDRPTPATAPPVAARPGARELDEPRARPPATGSEPGAVPRVRAAAARGERGPPISPREALTRIPSCARGAAVLRALDEWADDECRRKFALSAHGTLGAKVARCPGEWDASNLPSIVAHLREARATCGPSTVRALEEALSGAR
ncbi:MAG: hypothetical protein AAFZ18_08870 [Myxococcota bacterium]